MIEIYEFQKGFALGVGGVMTPTSVPLSNVIQGLYPITIHLIEYNIVRREISILFSGFE